MSFINMTNLCWYLLGILRANKVAHCDNCNFKSSFRASTIHEPDSNIDSFFYYQQNPLRAVRCSHRWDDFAHEKSRKMITFYWHRDKKRIIVCSIAIRIDFISLQMQILVTKRLITYKIVLAECDRFISKIDGFNQLFL